MTGGTHRLTRPRWWFVALLLLVVAMTATWRVQASEPGNPFLERPPHLVPGGSAQRAAAEVGGEDGELLDRLAAVPTAQWLTPEATPLRRAGGLVGTIAAGAREAERTPVFVVYGIAGRDCADGHSAGGLSAPAYLQWVAEIAIAAGRGAVVILEPDALALAEDCGGVESRTTLLKSAVRTLVSREVTVYLDAGHANWTDPGEMARRLELAGVALGRGFAVNVANYDFETSARDYADQLRAHLAGPTHFVIDTGRSGAGTGDTWCNPAGRALGPLPEAFNDSSGLDAWLWIKPPGESDGTCQGGPPAGTWWTAYALELARNAGW